jgi:allantoicase
MIMDDEGDEKKSLIQSTDKSIDYGKYVCVAMWMDGWMDGWTIP